MYAYSLRERTHAAYHYQDDVSEEVKQRRLAEIIETFRRVAGARNALEVGKEHLVLVEGLSKRSTPENPTMTGRNDNNKRCIISPSSSELGDLALQAGDYVRVRVKEASAQTLFCEPLEKSSISEFYSTTSEGGSKSQREAMM
jgi:tRNA A37 methylthiotransferase MiaB